MVDKPEPSFATKSMPQDMASRLSCGTDSAKTGLHILRWHRMAKRTLTSGKRTGEFPAC